MLSSYEVTRRLSVLGIPSNGPMHTGSTSFPFLDLRGANSRARMPMLVNYNENTINGMRLYLSKKVNVPTNTELQCVEWNNNRNFIAIGGTNNVLKVVKLAPLELGLSGSKPIAMSSNLQVNQNLDGHMGTVMCVTWNEAYQKLTSSDSNGLITVWSLGDKDQWYEEMINNRNKSVVVGMAWNHEGTKIAIAYQDGQVIVGTNDGNRIWNKDVPGGLVTCEWSPDGNMLLFGMSDGEVHIYDSHGNSLSKLHIAALDNVEIEAALASGFTDDSRKDHIITIRWWAPVAHCKFDDPQERAEMKRINDMRVPQLQSLDALGQERREDERRPQLLVAYAHGVLQMMRSETDGNPIVVKFNAATLTCARWSSNGAFVAITAMHNDRPPLEKCYIHIVSAYGQKLTYLRIPGQKLNGCAWDPTGLRVALAVDSNLYFANIKPKYKWGFCGQTVVYCYEREEPNEFRVIFFETKLEEHYVRNIRYLRQIACNDEYCIIVNYQAIENEGKFHLQLCNGIGTSVDNKNIDIEPQCIAMNSAAAVIAGGETYFIWHFTLPKRATLGIQPIKYTNDEVRVLDSVGYGEASGRRKRGADNISAVCIADEYFMAACESGILFKIALADGSVLQRYSVPPAIDQIQLNPSFKRLAALDRNSILQFFDVGTDSLEKVPNMEKGDVWSFRWEAEKDDSIAFNEKTKMVVMRGNSMEEGVSCYGYICQFKDLAVKVVNVDSFLVHCERPEKRFVQEIEIKALREAKLLMERMKIQEATEFIERNPHRKLWSLLAEVALAKLDIETAEHAYIKLTDYCGLQFCKKLRHVQNDRIKAADVAAHLGQLETAEKLYLECDRSDLVIRMYRQANDWLKVLHFLLKDKDKGDDNLRQEAWNRVGDYYADRQKWKTAAEHYEHARNLEQLLFCYLKTEDYDGLDKLSRQLPDGHELLPELAFIFGAAGLCEQSVDCYLRCDKVKEALDICIQLNQWDTAVALSREHKLRDVGDLLGKYAAELTGSNERTLAAVQLYRRAGRYLDAARIVFEIADEERTKMAELMRLKKLYTLAALLVEEFHEHNRSKLAAEKGADKDDASVALSGLLSEDYTVSLEDSRMIDHAWRGALAYHFFMLAQQQLYQGNTDAAMKTAVHLTNYDDILDPFEVYSLLALSSTANRQFSVSSRAFMRLERMESEANQGYKELALKIFSKYPPTDTRPKKVPCPSCEELVPDYAQACFNCHMRFPICIASGSPLLDFQFWLCPVCHQRANENHIQRFRFCPLCHTGIGA